MDANIYHKLELNVVCTCLNSTSDMKHPVLFWQVTVVESSLQYCSCKLCTALHFRTIAWFKWHLLIQTPKLCATKHFRLLNE